MLNRTARRPRQHQARALPTQKKNREIRASTYTKAVDIHDPHRHRLQARRRGDYRIRWIDTNSRGAAAQSAILGSTGHGVTFVAQIFGEIFLHLRGCFEWHWVEMRVQLRHQPNAIFPNDSRRLVSVLMIFKAMIDRQPRHADINARPHRIPFRIQPQNRRFLERSSRQQNHIHAVMKLLFHG